ncbi:hypothetical protein [Spirosoma radiotolerans]|uniref:Uncharacterized protein n=1 Tax=Spirosoma radiotolerans TaxID=1379870 RepID=A0A0E3V8B7_9BACT|nr:hypothetical protein [Spirosoma radiotolerans]AKD56617.1 hypothetical protein SD10_18655 [Spirosoma radiotolerans]
MLLAFTAIDEYGHSRDFSWWFTSLEFALDVMSSLSAKGKQIVKAELIDNDRSIQLPVDGFDGKLFSTPIKQLENEWQQLLKAPVSQRYIPVEPGAVSAGDFYFPLFDEQAWDMATVKFED